MGGRTEMNNTFLLLISNAVSIACVIGAVNLASKGTEGWGWFLLVALLCSTTLKTTDLI
jgi:hypothetical protein